MLKRAGFWHGNMPLKKSTKNRGLDKVGDMMRDILRRTTDFSQIRITKVFRTTVGWRFP